MIKFFKFEKLQNWRRKYSKLVNTVAILVVFSTTYALILPALTLDQDKVAHSAGIHIDQESTEASSSEPLNENQTTITQSKEESTEIPSSVEKSVSTDSTTVSEANTEPSLIVEPTIMLHKGNGYELSAEFDEKAKFPIGVELNVKELDPKSAEYQQHYEKTKDSLKTSTLTYARFFDISFTYDGKEVEPASPVKIKIKNDNAVQLNDDSKMKVVHFENEDKVEVVQSETKEENNQVSEVSFNANSFSVYGDVAADYYNIDFIFVNDDGSTNTISTLVDKTPGSKIGTLPEAPFKHDYVFSYWKNRDTGEKVDENTVVTGNMTVEAVFVPIDIYTIEVTYFYHNNSKNQDVIIDKETVQLEASDTPYQITPPNSTQVSSQVDTSLPADAIYYPEKPILELTAENLKKLDLADGQEDRKISQSIKYVPYNAEYEVYYMLKNLNGTGYSQIQLVPTKGVLGSTVTPQILTYNYATYEKSDTAKID